MALTYRGEALFGSGPYRVQVGPTGSQVVSRLAIDGVAGTFPLGALELKIEVTGRLIASNDDDLWSQRLAIGAQQGDPVVVGDLVDDQGREFTGVVLSRFEPTDRVDRGRVVSQGYRATFVRFA